MSKKNTVYIVISVLVTIAFILLAALVFKTSYIRIFESLTDLIHSIKYYFCKLFKQQQGVTIHQYVTNFRINKAKEMLAYSKLSVNTISAKVGFKNSLTFIRAFERAEKMTPSEYRSYYQ